MVQLEGGEAGARAVLDLFRRDPELRCDHRYVAQVLGAFGPKALPAFEEGLRDETTQVRYFAVLAIPRLRPLPQEAEKVVQHAIDWDVGDVRSAAVGALDEVRAYRQAQVRRERERSRRWLSEFPPYPRARRLCTLPGRSIYATPDALSRVRAFYGFVSGGNVDLVSDAGRKRLSIRPAAGSYPGCGVSPRPEEKTALIVSQSPR